MNPKIPAPSHILLIALSLMLISLAQCSESQSSAAAPAAKTTDSIPVTPEISFAFVGDIMQHDSQIEGALQPNGSYDYAPVFDSISRFLTHTDFTIGNLEVTLSGRPYTGYPAFSAPDTLPWTLRRAGFNALTTTNNHSLDKGIKGLKRTLRILDSAGMPHTGTYATTALRDSLSPLILVKDTLRVALLAYSYGSNVPPSAEAKKLIDFIDTIRIAQDIAKAKRLAHAAIVSIHWGLEYQTQPSAEQRRIARFLHRQGIPAIIGSHPHVLQPIEISHDSTNAATRLTAFSLGNFVSAQRTFPRAGGLILYFSLRFVNGQPQIIGPRYLHTYVYRSPKGPLYDYRILPILDTNAPALPAADLTYIRKYLRHAEQIITDTAIHPLLPIHPAAVDTMAKQ